MRCSIERIYDRCAKRYDEIEMMPAVRLDRAILWHIICRLLPESRNARILDAGGGTGHFALRLGAKGYDVVLCDISQKMLNVAKKKIKEAHLGQRITVLKADICDLRELKPNDFDLTLCLLTLSYCQNAEAAVAHLARVTKRGCSLVVSAENKLFHLCKLISREGFGSLRAVEGFEKTGIEKYHAESDMRTFSPKELRTLMSRHGVAHLETLGHPLFIAGELEESSLEDEQNFKNCLELNLRYLGEEGLMGGAKFLEFIGKKRD